ncbi:MAG: aminotransferase [Rhodobacterales bacterium]|nr:MAG: aminotransferase [Rhodobacterales bacterium]
MPNFDTPINRIGTNSLKWDMMEARYGVSPKDGLAMWVADMDFEAAPVIREALQNMVNGGIYAYPGADDAYRGAIQWWMQTRHGWTVDPGDIFTTAGVVNGVGMCLHAFTEPGDGIVLTTPVYHAFASTITAAGREVTECALTNNAGHYEMDFERWETELTGRETMFVLCSPHNPGGRVWTREELEGVVDFCAKHDLILVSDEIHHDLTMPGQTHIPMANIEGAAERLIMLSAATKTFNIAGGQTGNAIISNPKLRARFAKAVAGIGLNANSFGLTLTRAAYSPEGAEWVDALRGYIDGNRKAFDAGIAAIPGLKSMALEATYLSWVDFSDTGMEPAEMNARVAKEARIAANHGATFGKGGETFLRFNLATQRARIEEAVTRLQKAFADLQ